MKVVIASNNKNKIKEFKKIFENTDFELYSLAEIGYTNEIEETGKTFKENSLIKAKTISKDLNVIAIADDSGLECEGLDGRPGVYSARYAGLEQDDDKNNQKLMEEIKNVSNRNARYVCAITLYLPNDKYLICEDYCEGIIIDTKRGDNGFGYDPYFYIPKFQRTMAEITLEEKNTISHRAKALEKLKREYEKIINS
ncbi:MAG: XTP/dITP diphosphatase [Anaeroplasmataceae bacterium]